MEKDEIYFMKEAIKEANKAALKDEVPVGAVLVIDNKIISRGHNLREETNDVTSHAEIVALRKACKKLKSWRLVNAKIYVTLEPCPMCTSALVMARIDTIVYGAKDDKLGGCGSIIDITKLPNFPSKTSIKSGVLQEECSFLLTSYFKNKRLK